MYIKFRYSSGSLNVYYYFVNFIKVGGKMTIDNLVTMFLLFIIYSFLGWVMETIAFFIDNKKLVNRGFLIGPYCPIYGVGCLLIIIVLGHFMNNPVLLFVLSALICSIVEYLTSFFMEKLFKARWWDYTNKKFNLNGRICLSNTIIFGILGFFILYFLNPTLYNLISKIPNNLSYIISSIILIIFIFDIITSCNLMMKIKKLAFENKKDNTEEIVKKVKEILSTKNLFIKRIIEASPNIKESIRKKIEELNKKRKDISKKISNNITELKNEVKVRIKNNSVIKDLKDKDDKHNK